MTGVFPIYETSRKDFQRFGNLDNWVSGIFVVPKNYLPPFFSPFVGSLNASPTELNVKKVDFDSGLIKVENGQIQISETTALNAPDYLTRKQKAGLFTYQAKDNVEFSEGLEAGIYYYEFGDGNTTFESEIFVVDIDFLPTISVKFDSTIITWDTTLLTFDNL